MSRALMMDISCSSPVFCRIMRSSISSDADALIRVEQAEIALGIPSDLIDGGKLHLMTGSLLIIKCHAVLVLSRHCGIPHG